MALDGGSENCSLRWTLEEFCRRFGRILPNEKMDKRNLLLIGPTGCGKTELAKTVAKHLGIPFAICDCTALTQASYYGEDVEHTLFELYRLAGRNVTKAEMGIVFLDEIDKLSISKEHNDVGGRGVRVSLLKMLEGHAVRVPVRLSRYGQSTSSQVDDIVYIDTTNILFIGSVKFDGLEKIVQSRLDAESQLDVLRTTAKTIVAEDDTWLDHITARDLVNYRMRPEFVGSFPMIVPFKPLDEQALVGILTVRKNSIISQYKRMLKMEGIKLTFDKEAIEQIARLALATETGARGLRTILANVLADTMFEAPHSAMTRARMTRDAVLGKECVRLMR